MRSHTDANLCLYARFPRYHRGEHSDFTLRTRFEKEANQPVPPFDVPPGKKRAQFTPDKTWPHCIAADPRRPERMYCGTFGGGLYRSDDAGETWQSVGPGITEDKVISVAVSPHEFNQGYGVVWAGTEPSRLFRSEDGGDSWRECVALQNLPSKPNWYFPARPYTHHVRKIQLDPHDPDRLFVAVHEGGVMVSRDRGQTFEDYCPDSEFDPHGLAMHPDAPGRLYVSAGGDDKTAIFRPAFRFGLPPFTPRLIVTRGGYAETADAGDSWQRKADGLESNHYLWDVAVDSADPETIIASASVSPIQAHTHPFTDSFLIRRTAGRPWERVSAGLPNARGSIIYDLAAVPGEPGVFYAANNHGVFRSADAGITWNALKIPWPARYHQQHQLALTIVR